jgi:hypothetical protein
MDMNIFKRDPGIPTLDVVIKHHKAVFDVAEKHPRGGAKTTTQLLKTLRSTGLATTLETYRSDSHPHCGDRIYLNFIWHK